MRSPALPLLALIPLLAAVPMPAVGSATAPVTCVGAIEHPIEARVVALDPIRRGATIRLEVRTRGRVDLGSAQARVIENRGVEVVGPARAALVAGGPGHSERIAQFRVVVPRSGHRALVQFQVEGEGPSGLLRRGVAYNLLPDGPAENLRPAIAGSGEALLEAPARRIDR